MYEYLAYEMHNRIGWELCDSAGTKPAQFMYDFSRLKDTAYICEMHDGVPVPVPEALPDKSKWHPKPGTATSTGKLKADPRNSDNKIIVLAPVQKRGYLPQPLVKEPSCSGEFLQ